MDELKGKVEVCIARQVGTIILRRLGVARPRGAAEELGDQM